MAEILRKHRHSKQVCVTEMCCELHSTGHEAILQCGPVFKTGLWYPEQPSEGG